MPYVKQETRDRIGGETRIPVLSSPGELNYFITRIITHYLASKEGEPRYRDYNSVIGVLEAVKIEVYRRLVVPFEDTKIAENGDVF